MKEGFFTEAEVEMLESITRFNKPGCLTEAELEVVRRHAGETGIEPIPIGLLRKAKALLASIHTAPIFKGAANSMIKMEELQKLTHLFSYSSEIDVLEEVVERMSVTIYMLWKALRLKGVLDTDDLIKAANLELADFDEMGVLEAEVLMKGGETNDNDSGSEEQKPDQSPH